MLICWFVSIKFIRFKKKNFFKKCLFKRFSFKFIGKTVPIPSIGIIMVALSFFFCFFLRKVSCSIFNNIVKSKCKTSFITLFKGYICYIILILISSNNFNHSKLGFQKYRLWRSFLYAISAYKQALKIHIPFLIVVFRESNEKYIFYCVLNLLNFMMLRNGKIQDKKFKSC